MIRKRMTMKFNPKKIKIIKIKNLLDTDRDGVFDFKDCRPFNPRRQHVDKDDWMETKDQAPLVYGEQKDWMTTKYKRRPKSELGRISREKLEERAEDRYIYEDMDGIIERSVLKNLITLSPSGYKSEIKGKNVQYYPYKENTVRLYDENKKVYHYIDVSGITPERLLSITDEDKKMIGDERKLKKYFYVVG